MILPLTVLRRLDCVLEPTKEKVLAEYARYKDRVKDLDPILCGLTGVDFYNISKLTLRTVRDDPSNIADQLLDYMNGFSPSAREVLDKFDFRTQVLSAPIRKFGYLSMASAAGAEARVAPGGAQPELRDERRRAPQRGLQRRRRPAA